MIVRLCVFTICLRISTSSYIGINYCLTGCCMYLLALLRKFAERAYQRFEYDGGTGSADKTVMPVMPIRVIQYKYLKSKFSHIWFNNISLISSTIWQIVFTLTQF